MSGNLDVIRKATGKSFRAPFAPVWKLRDGTATSFPQYTDTAVQLRPLQEQAHDQATRA